MKAMDMKVGHIAKLKNIINLPKDQRFLCDSPVSATTRGDNDSDSLSSPVSKKRKICFSDSIFENGIESYFEKNMIGREVLASRKNITHDLRSKITLVVVQRLFEVYPELKVPSTVFQNAAKEVASFFNESEYTYFINRFLKSTKCN